MKNFCFNLKTSFILLFFVGLSAHGQNLEWIKSAKSLSGYNYNFNTTVDINGNIYVAGTIQGSFDADFGDGEFILSSIGSHRQTFILKLDPAGNFIWAKTLESASGMLVDSVPFDITTEDDNTVYVSGIFWGEIDFDPGDGTYILTSLDPTSYDGYILRLDGDGNFEWAHQYGGTPPDELIEIATDSEGNLYSVGYFSDTIDFDNGPGEYIEVADSIQNGYLLKINPEGDFEWVQVFHADIFCRMRGISISPLDEIYVIGEFRGTVDADPGPDEDFRTSTPGLYSMLMAKFDVDGNYQWSRQNDSDTTVYPENIFADNDCVYIGSSCKDSMDVDPGPGVQKLYTGTDEATNSFIQKLDSDGEFIWGINAGGSGDIRALEIKKGPNGHIFVAGFCRRGSVDLDPSAEEFIVTTPYVGSQWFDGYIQEFDSLGNLKWAYSTQTYGNENFRDFDISDSGHIYIIGSTEFSYADFDLGPDTLQLHLDDKMFVWKMGLCESVYDTLNEMMCNYYTVPSGDETYSVPGTYSDTIAGEFGCESYLTINVTDFFASTSLEFEDESYTAYPSGLEYAWIDCDNLEVIAGENEQTFTPLDEGRYAAIIYYGECSDTTDCAGISDIGIRQNNTSLSISIYPNPSNGLVDITLSEPMEIRIYSTLGQLIFVKTVNDGTYPLDLSTFSSGMYILSASSLDGREIVLKKIILN